MELEAPTSNSSSQYFRILDLPVELRLLIWSNVFEPSIQTLYFLYKRRSNPDSSSIYPPLLQTCRRFRHEATKIYFDNTWFTMHVDTMFDMEIVQWMQSLDQDRALPHMRNIAVFLATVGTLRGKLYCLERFLAWLDDNIPHHHFTPSMLWTWIPTDWTTGPSEDRDYVNVETLRSMFDSGETHALNLESSSSSQELSAFDSWMYA